jgi:hypothetical protein
MDKLRANAAKHGVPIEEEALNIIHASLAATPATGASLLADIRARVESHGGKPRSRRGTRAFAAHAGVNRGAAGGRGNVDRVPRARGEGFP